MMHIQPSKYYFYNIDSIKIIIYVLFKNLLMFLELFFIKTAIYSYSKYS